MGVILNREAIFTGHVTDNLVLQAAMLHDTVEDTETTLEEIEEVFGSKMRRQERQNTSSTRAYATIFMFLSPIAALLTMSATTRICQSRNENAYRSSKINSIILE